MKPASKNSCCWSSLAKVKTNLWSAASMVPCFQPLLSLKSDLAALTSKLSPALALLTPGQKLWLELVLTGEDALLSDIQLQLQQQLADLPVELLKLRREKRSSNNAMLQAEPSLLELTPAQVLAARFGAEALSDELAAAVNSAASNCAGTITAKSG